MPKSKKLGDDDDLRQPARGAGGDRPGISTSLLLVLRTIHTHTQTNPTATVDAYSYAFALKNGHLHLYPTGARGTPPRFAYLSTECCHVVISPCVLDVSFIIYPTAFLREREGKYIWHIDIYL